MGNENGHFREFGRFRLDAERRVLWFEGEPVNLPLKEVEILCVLTENAGEVVTKDEIVDRVWADSFVEESNLSRHIYLLRKTFKDYGESGDLIKTVPRRGYRFNLEVTEVDGLVQNSNIEKNSVGSAGGRPVFNNRRLFAVLAVVLLGLLVVAAWQFSSSRAVNNNRLAIIPFSSLDQGEKNEFTIRLTDGLIKNLGKIKTLEVLPFKLVRGFVDQDIDATSAARALGSDLVLTGDYLTNAENIRANVKLMRLSDNTMLLDESFTLDARENIDFETAVALRTSKLVSDKIRNHDLVINGAKVSPEALDNYVKGREIWRQQTLDRNNEMRQHFERAVELAPNWSPAYSALAEALLSPDRGAIDFENAEANARKALELDPQNPGANAALGQIYYSKIRDWETAESYFQRALAADPGYTAGLHQFARFLMFQRRFVAARQMLDKAIELDPVQPVFFDRLCELSYYERKTKDALINCEIVLSLNPTFSVAKRFHAIYILEKKYSKIADLYSKGSSDDATGRQLLNQGVAKGDLTDYWEYSIEKLIKARAGSASQYRALAHFYMLLNRSEEALDALEQAADQYDTFLAAINVDPVYDPLRSNPRFKAVIAKLGL